MDAGGEHPVASLRVDVERQRRLGPGGQAEGQRPVSAAARTVLADASAALGAELHTAQLLGAGCEGA